MWSCIWYIATKLPCYFVKFWNRKSVRSKIQLLWNSNFGIFTKSIDSTHSCLYQYRCMCHMSLTWLDLILVNLIFAYTSLMFMVCFTVGREVFIRLATEMIAHLPSWLALSPCTQMPWLGCTLHKNGRPNLKARIFTMIAIKKKVWDAMSTDFMLEKIFSGLFLTQCNKSTICT